MTGLVPWSDFGSLSTNMENLFNQVLSDTFSKTHSLDVLKGAYPRINTLEFDDKIIIEAAVPGLTKEDINVEWKEGVLTLRGHSQQTKTDAKIGFREIHKSSFVRSFSLNENDFNIDTIGAKVENGLLTITIEKFEPPVTKKPKQILIK